MKRHNNDVTAGTATVCEYDAMNRIRECLSDSGEEAHATLYQCDKPSGTGHKRRTHARRQRHPGRDCPALVIDPQSNTVWHFVLKSQ